MKSFLEEDKEVRYFPNDSEMPILIHYLQVYFSHPERSIQRSQVVQSVVSILSSKNKHWNHRTVRLWFNNNKRVFFRPTSPIAQSSNPKDNNLQQRTEQSTQIKTPLYIPARPLSVVQLSSAINRSPIPPAPVITKAQSMPPPPPPQPQQMQHMQQMQKMTAMNMNPSIQMNNNNLNPMNQQQQQQQYQMRINQTYQRSPYLIQQPPPPNTISQQPPPPPPSPQPNLFMMAKPGSFALTLNSEVEAITTTMLNNPQNLQQVLSNIEKDITEKISQLHEQRWVQLVTVQPNKTSIIDNKAVEQISNDDVLNTASNNETTENIANSTEKNGFQLQGVSNFDMIDCALVTASTGEPAVISWDLETHCQRFHFKDHVCPLCSESAAHFTSSNAKAIGYSENNDTFWVNSGNFLRPYSAADLSEGPNIKASLKYSERSSMTFWNENLVLASGSSIMSWSPKNLDDVLRGGKETENDADDESDESEPQTSYTLMIPSITSLTTVGENLVVASAEHHTAQVYATNGALVAKCIGHTSGITCLHSFDTNSFITGSADQTAKYWDIRVHVPVFNLLRHRGVVTGVYGCGNTNPNLVITGGTDGVIRGWDIRQLRHLFALSVGIGSPIAIGVKQDEPVLSIVTSERPNEFFIDQEKYGPKLSPKMKFLDAPPNAVLTYSMPA